DICKSDVGLRQKIKQHLRRLRRARISARLNGNNGRIVIGQRRNRRNMVDSRNILSDVELGNVRNSNGEY
ncbi:hypothetical protein, partial [Klebsiella pneumoniae]|uniref:hypothetical protein n=1 Tax=Klebsiella pneumoniae TaxID=573 RepID=UPI001C8F65AB